MNRAQEIRQKRLKERERIADERRKKVIELFDWVLDLLEHPTSNNTADMVVLLEANNGKIKVGYGPNGYSDKPFDMEVMQKLAELFNAEDGYKCEFYQAMSPDSRDRFTIEIL